MARCRKFSATMISFRTFAAASAIAFSFPKAVARGMYFMPQSGAGTSRSAGDIFQPVADAVGDDRRHVSISGSPRSSTPSMIFFAGQILQHAEIELGLRRLDRDLLGLGVGQLGEEGIAGRLGRAGHHGGIAEAEMHHRRHGDALRARG